MPSNDAQRWNFVQAKYYKELPAFGQPGARKIRVLVLHDMEAPETNNTAENVARYFQHPDYPSSAHLCVDNNSIVQCVRDQDVAYAAPGANSDGIQVELAGYGRQSKAEWLDPYGIALLALASDAVAQYCLRFHIPPIHLFDSQLEVGAKGIVGHAQVSRVYKKSDHTDPGPGFPWEWFIASVSNFILARR